MTKIIFLMVFSIIHPLFATEVPVEMNGHSLNGLSEKLATLERFIYKRFGGDPAYQQAGAHPPEDPSHTMMLEKFQNMSTRMSELTRSMEELQHQVATLKSSSEKMQAEMSGKVNNLETQLLATHETVKKTEEQSYQDKINKMSANELFLHIETAGRMLAEDRFEKALRLFSTKFPSDNRIASVYKELVYITYKKEDYAETAFYAGEFYKKSPKAPEAPEILLMMASALNRLGKTNEACMTIEKIKRDYAQAAATEEFKERLDMTRSSFACPA